MFEDRKTPAAGVFSEEHARPSQFPHDEFCYDDETALVDAISKVVALVPDGNELRFAFWSEDGHLLFRRRRDAEIELAKYSLCERKQDGSSAKYIPGITVWLKSSQRREYKSVVFNPNVRDVPASHLNTWRGFAVEPKAGAYPKFRDHLFANVCNGNLETFEFLLALLAQMFQEPWRKVGVAIVFRGEMGVGKSVVSEWIGRLVGPHYTRVIDKPHLLTGKFTGQLENCILARVEEGHFPGDPAQKSSLKHIITSNQLMYEKKGRDAYSGPNYTRVLITSNSDWVVPASTGERRYFFLDVSNARKQDGAYFAAIQDEMENGGAEAFMMDLMNFDYSKVDFSKPPLNAAMREQIELAFSPQENWLASFLTEGRLPSQQGSENDPHWELHAPFTVSKDDVANSYRSFVHGYKSPVTNTQVFKFLNKVFPNLLHDTRPRRAGSVRTRDITFPPLARAREEFLKSYPEYSFPPENPNCSERSPLKVVGGA